MEKFETQLKQYPIEVKLGIKVNDIRQIEGGLEAVTDGGLTYRAKAALFATGKRSRELGVPGEERLRGRGVTYCSVCDGPVFSGEMRGLVRREDRSLVDRIMDEERGHVLQLSELLSQMGGTN